jgi:hypothetical protein
VDFNGRVRRILNLHLVHAVHAGGHTSTAA